MWTGAKDDKGYGMISRGVGQGLDRVHVVAYEMLKGKTDLSVLHTCDNRPCCRPDHLFEGTQADNVKDMISKGRAGWQRGICV